MRSPGSAASTSMSDADSNADAVTPITLSAYSFGAVRTAKPSATEAASTRIGAGGCTDNSSAVRAAPTRVPQTRLTVRTNTDAYSGRTITATVSGNQKEWSR